MPKNILKIASYVLFGLFIFLYFTYLNFPYHKMKDQLFSEIERQSGFQIESGDFNTTFGFGFVLDDVTVENPNLRFPRLQVERIKISPSPLSLLRFRPKVRFHADLKYGKVDGAFQQKSAVAQNITLRLNDIKVGGKSIQETINLDIDGLLEGKITLSGNLKTLQNLNGNTDIQLRKLKLGKLNILNMSLPDLTLSQIALATKIVDDKIVIEKFDVGGNNEDLYAITSGDILLNPRDIQQSRLNLKLKFKLSKRLADEFSLFLPFIAGALGSDGFYTLKIDGRLGAPRALPERG